jgi:hypothetical protein
MASTLLFGAVCTWLEPGCTTRRDSDRLPARTAPVASPRVSSIDLPGAASVQRSEPRPGRTLRQILGVSSKFAQGQPESDLGWLVELGVSWVRDSVPWHVMEPKPGQFNDFPPDFQRRLEFYKSHGIGLVFMLAYDNYVAYARTAKKPAAAFDPVAYGRWSTEVAKRLRSAGVRFVLELWNEPHNMVLRPVLGGSWTGAPPSPWVQHYVRMVHEAVKQVKEFDPSIRVIDDDDMWVVHYWFLEEGLPTRLDGFAFHPYVQGFPERAAVDQRTQWVAPFVAVDPDGSFKSAVRRLRERGQSKLARQPEMWITEWGWPAGEPGGKDTVFPEQTVAAWLPRAFVLAEAAGVEALCWFSTQDNVDGPMGLTRNDGQKRKAYYAYKSLNESLGDYTYLEQIAGTDRQTSGPQAYLFHRGSRAKVIAWSIEPTASWLELDGALISARVTDTYGQPVPPVRGMRGGSWVKLQAAPVYLDFGLPSTPFELHISEATTPTPP